EPLLLIERGNERRGLLLREMCYHHLAQGIINGEPVMASFCGVCNSGAALSPMVNGTEHHFSCGGLYNGTAFLTDAETGSAWDHMTGVCLHGNALAFVNLLLSCELLQLVSSDFTVSATNSSVPRGLKSRALLWMKGIFHWTGWLPPMFTGSMGKEDSRLPRMTVGAGVVDK
ncbi:unnamed protein product, partial [Chrysoparadoxa australica]